MPPFCFCTYSNSDCIYFFSPTFHTWQYLLNKSVFGRKNKGTFVISIILQKFNFFRDIARYEKWDNRNGCNRCSSQSSYIGKRQNEGAHRYDWNFLRHPCSMEIFTSPSHIFLEYVLDIYNFGLRPWVSRWDRGRGCMLFVWLWGSCALCWPMCVLTKLNYPV